ncbi:hypothetical protein JCM8097_009110 [Rhodosporidiobolus ruineniae]
MPLTPFQPIPAIEIDPNTIQPLLDDRLLREVLLPQCPSYASPLPLAEAWPAVWFAELEAHYQAFEPSVWVHLGWDQEADWAWLYESGRAADLLDVNGEPSVDELRSAYFDDAAGLAEMGKYFCVANRVHVRFARLFVWPFPAFLPPKFPMMLIIESNAWRYRVPYYRLVKDASEFPASPTTRPHTLRHRRTMLPP